MTQVNGLSESMKNCLEAVCTLQNIHRVARSKGIAEKMAVNSSSVTNMLKILPKRDWSTMNHMVLLP